MYRWQFLPLIILLALLTTSCGDDDSPVGSDITPPTVIATRPADGATGVPITSTIQIEFRECIDPASVVDTSIVVFGGVEGTITCSDSVITFTPDDYLEYSHDYEVCVMDTVTDRAGNALEEDYVFSFTTELDPMTGIYWFYRMIPPEIESGWFMELAVSNGAYVALDNGFPTGDFIYSNDGDTWYFGTTGEAEGLNACSWLDTAFFAFGTEGNVFVSRNGADWTRASSSPGPTIRKIVSTGSLYVGTEVGYGHNKIFSSTDGVNWTELGDYEYNYFNDICWTGTMFVAAVTDENSLNSSIWTSEDAVTWTSRYTNEDHYFLELEYSGQEFLCTASNGFNLASTDGINWTPITNNFGDAIHELIWADDRWVGIGGQHYILSSTLGRIWDTLYALDPSAPADLRKIAWIDYQYIVVGSNIILTTPY